MRQVEALVTHLRHGLRIHFERHTIAVLTADARGRVARQRIVQLLLDPGCAAGALEGMTEAVEDFAGIGDPEVIGVPRPPLRPVPCRLPGDGRAQSRK